MPDPQIPEEAASSKFRRTLIQVLIVQVVALALLGLVQIYYNR